MSAFKAGQKELPDAEIEHHVGATSYKRGRNYANKNLVKKITYDEPKLSLSANIQGSNYAPYTTRINFRKQGETYKITGSYCSCPMRGRCKHVAALALSARHLFYVSYASTVPEAKIISPKPVLPVAKVVHPKLVKSVPKLSAWEKQLDQMYDEPRKTETVPLALFFELVEVDYYDRGYYGRQRQTRMKLGIRPAALNPLTGKWVIGDVNWKNIRYSNSKFDEKQLSFLYQLWSVYMAGMYAYYSDRYVFLDDFASPHVDTLLTYGRDELGVAYINGNKDRQPIIFAEEEASISLAINKISSGDLELKNQVKVGDKIIAPEKVGFIGLPAKLIYIWDGDHKNRSLSDITLAKLDGSLTKKITESVKSVTSTRIPKADIPKFISTKYTKLARQISLSPAPDLGIALPELQKPHLSLKIDFQPERNLRLMWGWNYSEASQTFALPLRDDVLKPAVVRDESREDEILSSVQRIGSEIDNLWEENITGKARLRSEATLSGINIVHFAQDILPKLQELPDVDVVAGKIPDFAEYTDKPTIEYSMKETKGDNDWFDLSVIVKLGDEEVPFNELFMALAEEETFMILESGSYFSLEHPELDRLRHLIIEARSLQDKPSDNLRLSPFQASLWDELIALGIVSEQAEAWNNSVKGLLDLKYIPKVPIPKNLKAKLRPYQTEGYQWLHFLWEHRLGGILADDMGLGKTLQTITLILRMKAETGAKSRGPVLIVAPTSVSANWDSEIQKFAPSLRHLYLQSGVGSPKEMAKAVKNCDVVLSTYGLFRHNFDDYQAIEWSALVLDEAQFVKNHQSKSYQCARRLNTPFKLALTGTPLENNLMELWSLLSIVASGLFPSPKRFSDFYVRPIEKEGNNEVLSQLRRRVRPLMLRRTKEQVAEELPPKMEQTLELELSPDHQRIYDTYLQRERQRVLGLLGDMDKNRFMIFKSITTLRMLSLDARLIDAKKYRHITPTKLDGFFEQLEPVLSEGHRALVFSQFTSFLSLLRDELDQRGATYIYLDGKTRNRSELLSKFKSSQTPLFLISLKAGGFGLNLTEADYCFLLDPWWNPAVEQQAIDRTHRIGQTKRVNVYRLVSKGTIEEKVMALKERKNKLFRSILDQDSTFAAAITPEDIEALFD
jgi:superfamily II DNA or RNA helicase